MSLFSLVKSVTEISAVSGRESMAFDELDRLFGSYFDERYTTSVGSYVGIRKCGKENAKKLILDAHLDEIGFMVKEICDGGFLKVTNLGGVDTKVLSSQEVWIFGKEKISGVFASKPPHLQEPGESEKKLLLTDMLIDTGRSKEYLEENVPLGTVCSYKTVTEELLGDRIVGKSMDDKICMATILRAIELLRGKDLNVDVYALFSAGEEVGYIGAKTAAFDIKADYAVAIDVTNSYVPESPKKREFNRLGHGGVVSLSPTISRPLSKRFMALLEEKEIPFQRIAEAGRTGTNAHVLQITGAGIPSTLISVPLRYMHTPNEVADLKDVENTARALAALAESLD